MDWECQSSNSGTNLKGAAETESFPGPSTEKSHTDFETLHSPHSIASSSFQPNNESDSEDDLPSCGIKLLPTVRKVNSFNEESILKLNIEEIRAKRKKDEQFFARMKNLDACLEREYKPNYCTTSNTIKTEDEDVSFILEKAKAMDIVESTITNIPKQVLMNPKQSLTIFNHETLSLDHFVQNSKLRKFMKFDSPVSRIINLHLCEFKNLSQEDEQGLSSYLLYIISVHPKLELINTYYNLLMSLKFYPCLSDFINVFRNWGCDLQKLYVNVPEIYMDVHDTFVLVKTEGNAEVTNHNLHYVLRVLKHIVQKHSPDSFHYLIEPLMRLYFDSIILHNNVNNDIICILKILSRNYLSKVPGGRLTIAKNLHRHDLSLYCQTIICTKILRRTPFASPLGYATLQQFSGSSDIMYCQTVNLDSVHKLLVQKKSIIRTSSYLDIFCYLTLIQMFLDDKRIIKSETNYERWHDLLNDWAYRLPRNACSADPVILKEKIAQQQYILRMRQVKLNRQRENSLQKLKV